METLLHGTDSAAVIHLQQQAPFRYVDSVLRLDRPTLDGVIRLNLRAGQDRWGGADALPGYLLIEAMAQAAGVLLRSFTVGEPGGFLVGIDDARLPAEVAYPADLELAVKLRLATSPFFTLDVTVTRVDEPDSLARASLKVMTRRSFA